MEMTLEEFLAQNSSVANVGLNFWETIGVSVTIFVGLCLISWIAYVCIKNRSKIKEMIKPYEEECPEWADKAKFEQSKVKRGRGKHEHYI